MIPIIIIILLFLIWRAAGAAERSRIKLALRQADEIAKSYEKSERDLRRNEGLELENYWEAQGKAQRREIISKCCMAPVKAKKQIMALTFSSIRTGHWFICGKCNKECAVISAKQEVLKAKENT